MSRTNLVAKLQKMGETTSRRCVTTMGENVRVEQSSGNVFKDLGFSDAKVEESC